MLSRPEKQHAAASRSSPGRREVSRGLPSVLFQVKLQFKYLASKVLGVSRDFIFSLDPIANP